MNAILDSIISFFENIGLIFDPAESPVFASHGKPFYISFEGLGIGQFKVNPVLLDIGNGIRWYGVLITIGMMVAMYYLCKRAKACGYAMNDLLDFFLFVVPVGVLGARLFYVFTADGYDLSKWYRIWDGGLAIYGGIIAGTVTLYFVARLKKVRILRLMDCAAPAVMIAQAIGRWGNFCNGEAFGANTDSFFRMGLANKLGEVQQYVHPTFLYESLWNVIGFVLINIFFKKKKFDGQIVLEYVGWYGLGRFFIELLRQDSLPLKIGSYSLRISAVIGFVCFVTCLVLFIIFISKKKSPKLALQCYYPGSKYYVEKTASPEEQAVSTENQTAPDMCENTEPSPESATENETENVAENVTEDNSSIEPENAFEISLDESEKQEDGEASSQTAENCAEEKETEFQNGSMPEEGQTEPPFEERGDLPKASFESAENDTGNAP